MSQASDTRTMWIIGAVLTAALIGLLYASFERVEDEHWVGMRDEARTQPMLAAGRMLRRLGIDAREVAQADWPPSEAAGSAADGATGPVATLLVWNPPERVDTPRARDLTAWVRGGGHLLTTTVPGARRRFVAWVFAGGFFDSDEPQASDADPDAADLLRVVPIARMSGNPDPAQDGEQDNDHSRPWRTLLDTMGGTALLGEKLGTNNAGSAPGTSWYPVSRSALQDPGAGAGRDIDCEPRYASAGHVVAMSCEVGRGRLTLVESTDEFLNHQLGTNGHAAALAGLLMQGRPGTVLIDLGLSDARPLLSWAVGRAPLALVLTVIAVVLLVWSRARRLGPAHDIAAPSRRALAEHLSAAGQFAWRHDRGQQLAERLEAAVRERAAMSIPGWRQMDAAAQAAAVTAITQGPGASSALPGEYAQRLRLIERALAGVPPRARAPSGARSGRRESAHDYTARVRTLNALWQALSTRSTTTSART